MRLTVLGCAGTYPSAESGCSSYLVDHDGFRLLLDAGNGAVGGIQRHGGLFDVDAVLLSHLHADHCVDLCAYSYALTYHPKAPGHPVPVWGPAGTRERLMGIFDQPPADRLEHSYTFHDLVVGQQQIGPFTVTGALMAHPIDCYGLRLQAGGRTLVYSADTGPNQALIELARGADLLLCEASWVEADDLPPAVHMTGSQAARHALAAGVDRLVLTHLVAWGPPERIRQAAERELGRPVEVAQPDAVWDV